MFKATNIGIFLTTVSVFTCSAFLVSSSVIAGENLKDAKPLPNQTNVDVTAKEALSGPKNDLDVADPEALSGPKNDLDVADPEALSGPDTNANSSQAQTSSVSQLSDVQPTDWAFQALQSLVERYGCIAGYPNGTYRGNRAMTRYEFAAGLNSCLDRVNELIAAGTSNLVRKEDLNTVQRLRSEFAPELVSLRGRVDVVEARTAELEASQFSTTTKFNGLAFVNFTVAKADGPVRLEGTPASITGPLALRTAGRDPTTNRPLSQTVGNPNPTLSTYVWLTFNTSFSGKDSLITQLRGGNGNSPANQFASAGQYNTFGVPFTDQSAGPDNGLSNVVLSELFYSFPIGKTLQVAVGPRLNWYRVFDNNRFTFILTGASSFNSSGSTLLNTLDRGSGAVVLWKPNKQFQLNVAYMGENTDFLPGGLYQTSSNPNFGLFGGTYTATGEITYSPNNNFNLRLLYNRSRSQQYFGLAGGTQGEPLYGLADDGFGGNVYSPTQDTYEANFDWLATKGFGLFGRYTYGSSHISPQNPARPRGDINAQAIQAGLAFPDLGKEGSLATFSFVIPFSVLNGRRFLVSNGGNGGNEYDFEFTYYYPLTDNIAIVPAFYFIKNANNFTNNSNIYVGNLRLQFSF